MAMAMSTVALIIGAAGLATQVVGGIKAGNAAKRQGEAAQDAANSVAELSDYNAAVATLQRDDALERGAEDEQRFRSNIRLAIGGQRAALAAQNVDVKFGSALDVQVDAAVLGELDALTIRTNARREAWGYEVQAEDLRRRAEIGRREGVMLEATGRANQSAQRWNTGGTLLSGSSSLLAARYGWGRT